MMYYAVKKQFSQEILITWEKIPPAIMLNEKSKIKVVYTVWSYSYPELSELS